jgi:hypothetical protein
MAWRSLTGWCSTVGKGITTPDGGTGTGAGGSVRRTPEEGPGASACAINVALDVCPCANDAAVDRPMPSAKQGMPIFKSGSFSRNRWSPDVKPTWPRVSARAFWLTLAQMIPEPLQRARCPRATPVRILQKIQPVSPPRGLCRKPLHRRTEKLSLFNGRFFSSLLCKIHMEPSI